MRTHLQLPKSSAGCTIGLGGPEAPVDLQSLDLGLARVIAYVSNYFFDGFAGADSWRWMLGVVAFPSLLFSIMVLFTPESPRWLLTKKGDEGAARKILAITESNVDKAVQDIKAANASEKVGTNESVFSKKYFTPDRKSVV